MRHTDITLNNVSIVERETALRTTFSLIHKTPLHCTKAIITYKVIDNLGNTIISNKAMIYNDQIMKDIVMNHSGYYKLVIEKVYYFDILQCLPFKRKYNYQYPFYVFPKMIKTDEYLKQNIGFSIESYEYDMLNKGVDYSEVFEIREYNEFDSLKHIHWKASMKKGDLYVKEGSQPILKKLLLTVECHGNKDINDKTLDIFYSLCLSLLEKGIDYEIICPSLNNQKYNIELIKSDTHFKECFQRILSTSYQDIDEYIQSIKEYSTLYIVKNSGIEVKEI
ncbi:MAG: DUF58 domain-containing protein [Coprobacillus sp.]